MYIYRYLCQTQCYNHIYTCISTDTYILSILDYTAHMHANRTQHIWKKMRRKVSHKLRWFQNYFNKKTSQLHLDCPNPHTSNDGWLNCPDTTSYYKQQKPFHAVQTPSTVKMLNHSNCPDSRSYYKANTRTSHILLVDYNDDKLLQISYSLRWKQIIVTCLNLTAQNTRSWYQSTTICCMLDTQKDRWYTRQIERQINR